MDDNSSITALERKIRAGDLVRLSTYTMIRLAVADDNQMIRSALRRFFSDEPGFEWVGEASDGEAAIQLVTTRHVDVLVLDLSMPVLGGLAALPRLKAAAAHLRVVVLSSLDVADHRDQLLELGVTTYLQKPADLEALLAAIRKAMLGASLGGHSSQHE